jgi:phosphate-selective porin OprO/OprP
MGSICACKQGISMKIELRSFLLASAAFAALSSSAFAAPKATTDSDETNAKIESLEHAVGDLNAQVEQLKAAQAASDSSAALIDLKRSTSEQYADLNNQVAAATAGQNKVGLDDGRLTFASADGRFSVSLRSLVQFDYGYFARGQNPSSVDLNSGDNFRRAQIGIVGTAWRDWSYNFTYDFGGNGTEKNGYIYYAYVQYNGLQPLHVRIGAQTPFVAIEDSTGSGDLLFLERASAVDVTRNIAGAPGREAVEVYAQGDNYLLSAAYTGKTATSAATFGSSQQAFVGRASWLAVNQPGFKWLVDADGTYLFQPPGAAANTNASNTVSFSNGVELAVDTTKSVNTGAIDASKVGEYGVESAAELAGFYGQAGWFHYDVVRLKALPDPTFSGWYGVLSYSLSGETHDYDPTTASFRNLKPAHPLDEGGWGAWEIAGRFSNIDLDFLPLKSAATGGVPGGDQNVWTVGLNWYPTNGLKFQLDFYNISAKHVNAPANNISADAVGIRTQIQF